VARQKDRMPHASQYWNPGRDRVPWTEGWETVRRSEAPMLHAGNGRQGYSFGWTNGGTEDILGVPWRAYAITTDIRAGRNGSRYRGRSICNGFTALLRGRRHCMS
jgi:hypothetical protein